MKTRRHTSRKRFPNWLRELVDSGEVHGVYWLDKGKTTFRVPWKRVDSPDFELRRDATLFQRWAEFTGRYRTGERADPSVWKTRFRCAIRKMTEIEEVKMANNLDDTNNQQPFRVFRFKEQETRPPKEKGLTTYKCRPSRGTGRSRPEVPLVYDQYSCSTSVQLSQSMFLTHDVTQSVTQGTAQTAYNGASSEFHTVSTQPQSESMQPAGIQHNDAPKLGHFPNYNNSSEMNIMQFPDGNANTLVNAQWPNHLGSDMGNTTDQEGFVAPDPLSGVPPSLPWTSSQELNRVFVDSEPLYASERVEPRGMPCSNVQRSAQEYKTHHSNQIFEQQHSQETMAYNTSILLNDLNEIFRQSLRTELERSCLSNSNGHDVLKIEEIQDCMLPPNIDYICDVY